MRHIYSKRGFTLVELLIATFIFSFSMMAIIPLLVTASGVTTEQSLKSEAYTLASMKLDELKILDKEDLGALITAGGIGSNAEDSEVVKGSSGFYTLDWQIDLLPAASFTPTTPTKPYYLLTASTTYTYKGQQRTRTLSTLWGY